jgi:hypothetical protein
VILTRDYTECPNQRLSKRLSNIAVVWYRFRHAVMIFERVALSSPPLRANIKSKKVLSPNHLSKLPSFSLHLLVGEGS